MGFENALGKLYFRVKITFHQRNVILLRCALVAVFYLAIFWFTDYLSLKFQIYHGVVAWYPPAGISLAFLFTCGLWFSPVMVLASIIGSLFIYQINFPMFPAISWAVVVTIVYSVVAFFMRRRAEKENKAVTARSLLTWVLGISLASALLSMIAIPGLIGFGEIPNDQAFNTGFQWWIGEMIGVLAFAPFMIQHVMPVIRRFCQGEKLGISTAFLHQKPNWQVIAQTVSLLAILYLVFGIPSFLSFQPYFLIAIPLIWVAMKNGYDRATKAVFLSSCGIMFAIWIFKIDPAILSDFQFLVLGIYFCVLLIGVIVTQQKMAEETLQNRETHFRAMIENAPDAILLLGADRSIKYVSPSVTRILGYDPSEREKISIPNMIHPDDSPSVKEMFDSVLKKNGNIAIMQYRGRHKNGSWRWLETIITNQTENPAINAMIVNFRDITERKLAEESLQQNEKRFRALLEQSQEAISLTDEKGNLTTESPTSLRPLGYSRDEFMGRDFSELFHPEDHEAAIKLFREVREEHGRVCTGIFRMRHDNGSWHWIEATVTNLLQEPAVHSIVINYRDITQRKQAEEEIEILARFASESPNPVLRMCKDGILLYANPASQAILDLWKCKISQKVPKYMADFAAIAFSRNETIPVEINCDEKIYSVLITPVVENGYINLYGRDITKRKQAEESLKVSNDELSRLFELAHSLAEADTLEDIFGIVNHHTVDSLHCLSSRIVLFEEGKYHLRAVYPVRNPSHEFKIGQPISAEILPFSHRVLLSNSARFASSIDKDISDEEKKFLFMGAINSVYIIPLRISGAAVVSEKLLGLLIVDQTKSEKQELYTAQKSRLARSIGDSAAVAIRRMLLREQTERRMRRLTALSQIDLAIITNADMRFRLDVISYQIAEQLKVDAVCFWKYDPASESVEFLHKRGFQKIPFEKAGKVKITEGEVQQAIREQRIVHVPNLAAIEVDPRRAKALEIEPFVSYLAVPLIVNDEAKGVLEIYQRSLLEPSEDWLQFLQTLANQAAIAIDNSQLLDDLRRSNIDLTKAYDATIQGWSRALDLRDNETEGHTQRVTEITLRLSRRFGISDEELAHIRRGALLHDIGKMGVPDRILLKPGPLTDEEWVVMKQHPAFAFDLLSPIPYLQQALDIPLCHHEKWDGSGYPRGLAGEDIPFAARLFAVVDVWDALRSDRPYRKAWTEEKTLEHIRSLSGSHFDPQVVKVCLESGLLSKKPGK